MRRRQLHLLLFVWPCLALPCLAWLPIVLQQSQTRFKVATVCLTLRVQLPFPLSRSLSFSLSLSLCLYPPNQTHMRPTAATLVGHSTQKKKIALELLRKRQRFFAGLLPSLETDCLPHSLPPHSLLTLCFLPGLAKKANCKQMSSGANLISINALFVDLPGNSFAQKGEKSDRE